MENSMAQGFVKWTLIFFFTFAAYEGVAIGFAGLILHLSLTKLVIPYIMLLFSALVTGPLIYWSRLSYHRPKSFARRFSFAIFVGSNVFMAAVAFDVIKLGILSRSSVLQNYVPWILPTASIAFAMVYTTIRQGRDKNTY